MLKKKPKPAQQQKKQPGLEYKMRPKPKFEKAEPLEGKLHDKVAIITGGDSGIGRAIAVAYAKEGADVAILYLKEHKDAQETQKFVEEEGRKCLLIACDIKDERACQQAVKKAHAELGRIDILVNNAAEQHYQKTITKITKKQLENTFATNIFAQFYLVKAVLRYLKKDSVIINTASVTAYRGSPFLLDYSSTKGAIISFTRSLAKNLAPRGIRVNAVAPGPIWTPLIPATMPKKKVKNFGSDTLLKRAGEPSEVAPAYVFLASADGSYFTGQVLHPNGGEIING